MTLVPCRPVLFVLALTVAHPPGLAHSQSLRTRVENLFRFGAGCDQPVCLPVGTGHGDHFNPEVREGQRSLIGFLVDAIATSTSSIPISSAASTSDYSRRSESGLPIRTRTSAGPVFAERASTIGRGRLLAGVNLTGFTYTTLRGVPLDRLAFNFTHVDINEDGTFGNPPYEADVIQVDARLSVNLFALTSSITYGVTDWADLSLAIPVARSSVDGSTLAQLIPAAAPSPHFWGTAQNPLLRTGATAKGSAAGLGDLAIRLKASVLRRGTTRLALLSEARLPTGREDDFLGSGATTFRGLGVLSVASTSFAPHLNLGYHYRGKNHNGALLATAGFDHLMTPAVTLAHDLVSEWQVGASKRPLPTPVTLRILTPAGTDTRVVQPSNVPDQRDDLLLTALGAKYGTERGFTLVTNFLVPVVRGGLQPNVAWTVGVEYSF